MNRKISEQEWLEDFQEFIHLENQTVPQATSASILEKIKLALQPSPGKVFAKLLAVHFVGGTLSLMVCNQFGLNPFQTSFSLSDYFMKFGHSTCMVLCGVLFLSTTLFLGRLVLNADELRVFLTRAPLTIFTLAVFSLVSFLAFGAEITLGIATLWLAGALCGGLLTTSLIRWGLQHQPA